MSQVKQLLDITVQLARHMNTPYEKNDRDTYIEVIQQLLLQREAVLGEIKPPFTAQEEEAGKQIVALNKMIDTKLHIVLNDIKVDMKQLKQQETTHRKYVNPYGNISADGMFFDKRN